MKPDNRSLIFRLLVPVLSAIVLIFLALLLLVSRITSDILDEYTRTTLNAHSADSRRILDTALAELSTARLLDNRTVVKVKQQAVLEALELRWKDRGIEGLVAGPGGRVLFSTLPKDLVPLALAPPANGHFHLQDEQGTVHGHNREFVPWQWQVVVTSRDVVKEPARKEVLLLVPIVLVGAFLLLAVLYVILHRNLQRPVAALIADVQREQAVAPTGVTELDQIGTAINDALKRVKERDERIRLLLSSMGEGIYGVDTEGTCTFCNPAALRMLKYEREEDLIGKVSHEIMHHTRPDGSPYLHDECLIYSAYKAGKGVRADHEVFWRKDGTSFPVEYWSYPVIKEGTVTGAVVTFVDITERKRAEATVREERNKFEAVVSAMADGISIQDRNYRVLYQNDVHKGFIGDHAGKLCYEAYESRNVLCDGCPVALTFADGQVHTSVRAVDLPGGTRHFEITTSALLDANGAIVAGIELVRDITERRRTEDQLRQAQKMEAIGQLAGGIAHDFNNILTAITGYASFLKLRTDEGSQLRYYGDQILLAAEKAANLTRQILAFSRKQVLEQRPVRVNEIVRGMEKIMVRLLGEDIDIRMDLTDRDTTVLADPGQLEQVLLNLATNARDAMPAGGRLHIGTEIISADPASAAQHNLSRPGRHVLLTFSDAGMGMTEKVRQRIFEPFFTTKELGRGTGLGLAIVYGIVAQHEGQINVYSEPGEGTTFRIYLPVVEQAEAERVLPTAVELPRGTETILLAEDDDAVRAVTQLTLEEAGYRVLVARDGEEAVQKFREHRDEVRLCLLDVIMPKKHGKATLDEIRTLRPGTRAIFMSGYAADIVRAKDIADSDITLLTKPIAPLTMLRKVRETLDA